ncbi:MAG: ECF-type sigma factor [Pirellulaceae bacterium]
MADPVEDDPNALTQWYQALQTGDDEAIGRLFEHCFPRLLRYARSKLPENLRRALDEEDVALSAFKSFCNGAQRGVIGDIQNRDELWKLLTCIAARKGSAYVRHETRLKRGGGQVRGESVFISKEMAGIESESPPNASPATIAEVDEQCQNMLDALGDETLQAIALLRLEGYSVDEIASRIGCAKRSVERRLSLIRKIWSEQQ